MTIIANIVSKIIRRELAWSIMDTLNFRAYDRRDRTVAKIFDFFGASDNKAIYSIDFIVGDIIND